MSRGRGAVQPPAEICYADGMNSGDRLFLGIDVGTGGARAMAVDRNRRSGRQCLRSLRARNSCPAARPTRTAAPGVVAGRLSGDERGDRRTRQEAPASPARLTAVAVDGTSGTLVALNRAGEPLRPALMYNDPRAADEADALNDVAGEFCQTLGYRFNASFALAKIAWLRSHEPAVFDEAARFVHQADYVVEQLTGEPAATDYSNALKTGYDLLDERWPAWIDRALGHRVAIAARGRARHSDRRRIAQGGGRNGPARRASPSWPARPTARPPFSPPARGGSATTTRRSARRWCSRASVRRFAVIRKASSIATSCPADGGCPGRRATSGTDWIAAMFPGADVRAMDAAAAERLPIDGVAYPLIRAGERFPFLAPEARGFFVPELSDPADRYAACLQGVALVERLGYEVLDAAGSAGGRRRLSGRLANGTLPTTSSVPLALPATSTAPAAAAAATSGCNAGPTRPAG